MANPKKGFWPPYSGKLSEPVYFADYEPRKLGLLAVTNEDDEAKARERLASEFTERVELLFAHYQVKDRSDWQTLALRLASQHIRGFQLEGSRKKKGRAEIWNDSTYSALLAEVERIKAERTCGDSGACQIIATAKKFRSAPWNQARKKPLQKRSLESRLSEARNPKHNLLANILFRPGADADMLASLLRNFGQEEFSQK